jgi:hypothetical protein
LKPVHVVLEGWLAAWLLLWRVTEPCGSHGGRIDSTVDHLVNRRRRQQIVTLINFPHPFFTVKRYTTVKVVRSHSERGKAAVPRVVGIVVTLPCCGMGVTAPVTS